MNSPLRARATVALCRLATSCPSAVMVSGRSSQHSGHSWRATPDRGGATLHVQPGEKLKLRVPSGATLRSSPPGWPCAIAKSLPRMPSSSPISVTMKSQSTVLVPRVTASLARPIHWNARPFKEHSRPQYFCNTSAGSSCQDRHPRPVSTRKLTKLPPMHPGRYSPFLTTSVPFFAAPPSHPAVMAATVRFRSDGPQSRWGILVQNGPFHGMCGTPCQPFDVVSKPFLRPNGPHCPPGVSLLDLYRLHGHLQRLAASLRTFQLQFFSDRCLDGVEHRLFLARIVIGVVGPTGQLSRAVGMFLG